MNFVNVWAGIRSAFQANAAGMAEQNRKTLSVFAVALLVLVAMSPELAMAAPWDGVADKVLEIFTGGLARMIAIICVIGCGLAALAGKLSWNWAIYIVIGIVLIFGSAPIVDYIISGVS